MSALGSPARSTPRGSTQAVAERAGSSADRAAPTSGLLRRWLPTRLVGPSRRAAWRRARLRKAVAVVLVGLAVWLLAGRLLPDPPEAGEPVLVAARDLPAGAVLQPADLRVALWPTSLRPSAALAQVADARGRTLAAAAGAGEPITPSRLTGPGLLTGAAPGQVAAHVSLADPALVSMVQAGDAVDVLSTADGAALARAVTVLSVDSTGGSGLLGADGSDRPAGVVVAASAAQAAAMARALGGEVAGSGLTLALRGAGR